MSMTDRNVASATIATQGGDPVARRVRDSKTWAFFAVLPWFAYLFVLYIVIELSVGDVRALFLSVGPFQLTWVEVMYVLANVVAMAELLRVARPGENRVALGLWMLGVSVGYLLVFVVSATGVGVLQIFNNTEFLVLTFIALTQGIIGLILNSRTLKRTSDIQLDHHDQV